jgi:aryl-alcohol dehydrogenase-like predicted oxidoreductase
MKQARLGRLDVARIGFGAMGMSAYYTGAREDDEQSIRTIHRAIDLGVTLIDTAEVYGPYLDEELVGRALTGRRDEVVLAAKFGQLSRRGETDTQHIDLADLEKVRHLDSAPANIRLAVEGSLRASGRTASTFIISTASTRPPRSRRPPEPSVSSLTRARSCTTGSPKRRRRPSAGRMRYVR